MRYTSFTGSCFGKITTVVVCILLGVILSVGGVALAGYIVLTREGMMGTIEEKAKEKNLPIDFGEEYEEMSVLNWGTDTLSKLSAINEMSLGELQDTVGYTGITAILTETLGIEESKFKESTFGNLGETITDNLTLLLAKDKFGMEYPSLPIFEDEEFLAEPISTAFKSLNDRTLGDLVEVKEDSSMVLKKLADMKIGEISDSDNGIDARINRMKLSDVIEITTDGDSKSHGVLIALKDITIGGLGGTEGKETINKLRLRDLIEIKDPAEAGGSSKFMWALRNASIATYDATYSAVDDPNADPIIDAQGDEVLDEDDNPTYYYAGVAGYDNTGAVVSAVQAGDVVYDSAGQPVKILGIEDRLKTIPFSKLVNTGSGYIWTYLGEATTETIGSKVDNMCVMHAVEITETSNAILRKMRRPKTPAEEASEKFGSEDLLIKDLGGNKLTDIVKDTEIGEIIDVTDDSPMILRSLSESKIGELSAKIASFKVADVLTDTQCNNGVMKLIDCNNTLITELPAVMTEQIKTSSVERLSSTGIVSLENLSEANLAVRARIRNQTMTAMVQSYAALMNNPTQGNNVTYLAIGDGILTQTEADVLHLEHGTVIVLTENTTLKGAFTKAYSFVLNGFNLILDDGSTVAEDRFSIRAINLGVDAGGYSCFSNSAQSSALFLSAGHPTGAAAGGVLYYGDTVLDTATHTELLNPMDGEGHHLIANATQRLTFEIDIA